MLPAQCCALAAWAQTWHQCCCCTAKSHACFAGYMQLHQGSCMLLLRGRTLCTNTHVLGLQECCSSDASGHMPTTACGSPSTPAKPSAASLSSSSKTLALISAISNSLSSSAAASGLLLMLLLLLLRAERACKSGMAVDWAWSRLPSSRYGNQACSTQQADQ